MSVMIYQAGSGASTDIEVWGRLLNVKIVSESEVAGHIDNGWYEHPDDVPAGLTSLVSGETGNGAAIDMGEVSDGHHTFNELYDHRVRLFSTLMRAFASQAWWSFQHSDGEQWDGWIIAGIDTPDGAVTYHLPESEITRLPAGTEIEFGKEWDGHTADDVLERLINLNLPEPEPEPVKKTRKPKAVIDEPDNKE